MYVELLNIEKQDYVYIFINKENNDEAKYKIMKLCVRVCMCNRYFLVRIV